MRLTTYALAGMLALILLSCDSDDPVRPDTGITAQNARTSECGGFSTAKITAPADTLSGETLSWRYDASAGVIAFTNSRVELNCCGKHSINAYRDRDTLVISESDQPADNGRCKCLCTFDFGIDVKGTFSNTTAVRLERTVDTTLTLTWTITIDLSKITGVETVTKEK